MRIFVPIFLALIPVLGSSAESPGALEKEMLLRLTDAYSQCSAYYEMAGAVLAGKDQDNAKREAGDLKRQANVLAHSTAEQLVSRDVPDREKAKLGAGRLVEANYAAAIQQLLNLARSDQNRFRRKIVTYRTGCRQAIRDPSGFADKLLEGMRKSRQKGSTQLPK